MKTHGDKKYKCDMLKCKKWFGTKYSLKRHMKSHKVKKDFKCKDCSKQFALQQYLTEHEFTHTRAKPFACNINGCQETFRQRGKRSLHQSLMHVPSKRRKPGEVNQNEQQINNNLDEANNFDWEQDQQSENRIIMDGGHYSNLMLREDHPGQEASSV